MVHLVYIKPGSVPDMQGTSYMYMYMYAFSLLMMLETATVQGSLAYLAPP